MNELIGKRFHSMFRCMDMLCLNFGESLVLDILGNGKEREVSEFSFHIQTQWRLIGDGAILLASRDIYHPFDENVPEDWDYDVFGRPKAEGSIFDALCGEVSALLAQATVIDCAVTKLGDLSIRFSCGAFFETFTPASRKEEFWRFINFKTREHRVVFDVDESESP